MEKERKGNLCGKVTKGIPTEEASVLCKGKSIGKRKKVEEGKEKRCSTCGQATRSATKVKEEFSGRVEKENRGALW